MTFKDRCEKLGHFRIFGILVKHRELKGFDGFIDLQAAEVTPGGSNILRKEITYAGEYFFYLKGQYLVVRVLGYDIRNQKQSTFVRHATGMLDMGKFLIISGIILLLLGLIIQFSDKIPFLGRLPGDIRIEGKNYQFYFPLTSSILISIIISLVLLLINKARQ